MIIKDIMKEKQLNFNQPLLSVRRFSSTLASETDYKGKTENSLAKLQDLPAFKSELQSGPVRDPGNVPFVWEKIPGRPKDESKSQTQAFEQPPITPNLPPGRVSKHKQQDSDIKGTMRTRSNVSNSQSIVSLDKNVTKHGSSKEEIQEKGSSNSDDGSETFLDACDTLSRTESFFMSCSGLSGWDDEEVIKPSISFSNDQQACDFMIDRFLIAAEAMTYEISKHASCRKPVVGQEQKQVKKVVSAEKSHPLNQHKPKTLPHYTQDIGKEGSADESDDCNGSDEDYTTTACGLFPRICLLNPIPGVKMEAKVQGSAVHAMQAKPIASHRTTKEHGRTPYGKKPIDSHSQIGFKGEKKIFDISEKSKHGTDSHQRGCSKLLACESAQCEPSYESPIVGKTLYVDSVHKVNSNSSSCSEEVKGQTNQRGDDFETLRRDSGFYKNPSIDSSLGNSKHLDVVDVKATLQPKSYESLDSPFLVYSENPSNGMQIGMTNHSNKIDSEKQGLTKPGIQGSVLDQDLVVISRPKVVKSKKIELESQVSRSHNKSDSLIQNSGKWADQECLHGSTYNPSTVARSKVLDDGKIDLESQCLMKLGHQERCEAIYLQLPLALPSLKAPSESWLNRILPTISSRNISSRSNNLVANKCARSQIPKTTTRYPMWENIVKSSNVHHHGHLKFPEELLTPIPEA